MKIDEHDKHERLIGRNLVMVISYTIKLVHCINVKVNMNNEYVYVYRRISLYPYRILYLNVLEGKSMEHKIILIQNDPELNETQPNQVIVD